MLLLSAKDILKTSRKINLVDIIEEAAVAESRRDLQAPERQQIAYGSNTHLIMPAYGDEYFLTGLLSIHPGNSKKGAETIQGTTSLNSAETGEPLCLLHGPSLNGLRTGATSLTGVKHLVPSGSKVLGIVGLGFQGYYQGISILNEHKFEKVLLFDTDLWKAEQMVEKFKQESKIANISVADDVESLMAECDIIVTATNSGQPVLPDDKPLLHGKTFIATGSFKPNMAELPKSLFEHLNKCIIDTKTALRESGDLIEPVINSRFHIDNVVTLGEYLENKDRYNLGKTRLFKTVGSAVYDYYIAKSLYEKAIEENTGQTVKF